MILEQKLPQLEQVIIEILESDFLPRDSYLAGGTALYYYLKHRVSIDIDFFSLKRFRAEALLFKARERFDQVDVEILEKESLILFLSQEKVKFSLFHLPYPLLSELNFHNLQAGVDCPLASLEDIEAMKAIAIAQRGSAKDFVDLFYLLKGTRHSFEDMFSLVQRKYQVDDKYGYHLKTAVVYFDDADREIGDIMLLGAEGEVRKISSAEWEDIKTFFLEFCR